MGKTVKKALGAILIVASFFVPAGLALGFSFLPASTFIAVSTILRAVGLVSLSMGFAKEPTGAGNLLADNLRVKADPLAVRSVIFGRSGVAGQVLFRENRALGDEPDELLVILGLAGYPCTSLEKFWLNGELVFDGDTTTGPGAITTGIFANDLWVWFRTGEELTDAFPDIAALSATWAAKTRILRGIPCVGLRIKVTEDLEGRFEPRAQVKGAKLYDPRLDSSVPGGSGTHDFANPTTWEFSENAKLPEILYERGAEVNGVRIFGMGKPREAIDLENHASEANIADEQIATKAGGTINRYTCNGRLIPDGTHRQNLELLLSASAGTMDASGGIYRTFAGAWRSSSMTLTEEDIDGAPTKIQLQRSPSDEINIISGSIADPNDDWEVKEYPELRDEASITQVGENAKTLDLPFTNDHRIAQRIAKIAMKRLNAARAFGGNYWLRTIPLQPGDIVTQTYTRYGITAETFRVDMWGLEASEDRSGARRLTVPMQLVEEQQAWFDWDAATEEKATTTITPLPSINRLPKLITLDGMPVFSGPLPPANPKEGWLWRDTDTNITFRWSGAAWVDFATETKTADQVDYLDGATVEDFQPAEPDADVTAPRLLDMVNPSYETGTLEGWETASGGSTIADSGAARSGGFHATTTLQPSASSVLLEQIMPAPPVGSRVMVEGFARAAGSPTNPNRDAHLIVRWGDATNALISTTTLGIADKDTTGSYQELRGIDIVPAGAVFMTYRWSKAGPLNTDETGAWSFDDCALHVIPKNADIDISETSGEAGTGNIAVEAATETFATDRDMGAIGSTFNDTAGPYDILTIPGTVMPTGGKLSGLLVGRIDNAAGSNSTIRLRVTWSGGNDESHTIPVEATMPEGGLSVRYTFDTIPAGETWTLVARLTVGTGDDIFVHKLRLDAEVIKR